MIDENRAPASAQLKADLLARIPSLRSFALSLCGNRDQADDLVQETLTKAWSHLGGFEEGTNLMAWLFTILRNAFYSEYRKRRYEVADSEGLFASRLATAPSQLAHMDMLDFRAALARITADQREALILTAASGFSCEEAAVIIGCATGTVKSRVFRARRSLEGLLSQGSETKDPAGPDGARGLEIFSSVMPPHGRKPVPSVHP